MVVRQLHSGSGTGKLVRLIAVQGLAGSQVIDRNGHIRACGKFVFYQRINPRRERLHRSYRLLGPQWEQADG